LAHPVLLQCVVSIKGSGDVRQQYIGCYNDSPDSYNTAVMMGRRRYSRSMTVEMCQQFCRLSTYTYFGL